MSKVINEIENTPTKRVTLYKPEYVRHGHPLVASVISDEVKKAVTQMGEGNYRITIEKVTDADTVA